MSFQQREFNQPIAKATLEMSYFDAVYCSWSSVDKNVISTEKATLEMPHYDAVYCSWSSVDKNDISTEGV